MSLDLFWAILGSLSKLLHVDFRFLKGQYTLEDQLTFKKVRGPYTILGVEQGMVCGPNFVVHLVLEERASCCLLGNSRRATESSERLQGTE